MFDSDTAKSVFYLHTDFFLFPQVRKSLETLSVLLHDSSKKYGVASGNPDVGNVVLESTSEYTT